MNLVWTKYKVDGKTYIVFKDLSIPTKDMIQTANKQYFRKDPDELQCLSGYLDKKDNLTLSSRYVEGCKQVVWCVCKR